MKELWGLVEVISPHKKENGFLMMDLSMRTSGVAKVTSNSYSYAKSKSASSQPNDSRTVDTVEISVNARKCESNHTEVPKATEAEMERLTEELKNDPLYIKRGWRPFGDEPAARKLMSMMILNDEDTQEKIASVAMESVAKYGHNSSVLLKDGETVKSVLLHGSDEDKGYVFGYYAGVLSNKAKTVGLTERERLLDSSAERVERYSLGTFDDQMAPVMKRVEKEFQNAGMEFDNTKEYSFQLDTGTFRLSVSGGTKEENEILERTLNRSSYPSNLVENNRELVLAALYSHRTDDMKFTPWKSAEQTDDAIKKYGVSNVPVDYVEKMKQLYPAYSLWKIDQSLQRRFGFGVDDIAGYDEEKKKLYGTTNEQTAAMARGGIDFMKEIGFAYIDAMKEYTGTPVFSEPLFAFAGGKFHALY